MTDLQAIRDRDAALGRLRPRHAPAVRDRRALLAEVDRLRSRVETLEGLSRIHLAGCRGGISRLWSELEGDP